jgi:hypothetical protein
VKQLLKNVEEDYVVVLQIHAIWWLSRGNAMTRLLQYMLALLELFKDEIMCSSKFQFYLNLLVDIL